MARKSTAKPAYKSEPDYQLEVAEGVPGTGLYEVLTEQPNGHRTVRRVNARDHVEAVEALDLDKDVKVLKSAPAGAGLGSGDPA